MHYNLHTVGKYWNKVMFTDVNVVLVAISKMDIV